LQATESTGHYVRLRICFILLSDTSCKLLIAPSETEDVLHDTACRPLKALVTM